MIKYLLLRLQSVLYMKYTVITVCITFASFLSEDAKAAAPFPNHQIFTRSFTKHFLEMGDGMTALAEVK